MRHHEGRSTVSLRRYLLLAVAAAAVATSFTAASANPQCLDLGPSQPFIGGPVPISRPQYVDPDPAACITAVITLLPPVN